MLGSVTWGRALPGGPREDQFRKWGEEAWGGTQGGGESCGFISSGLVREVSRLEVVPRGGTKVTSQRQQGLKEVRGLLEVRFKVRFKAGPICWCSPGAQQPTQQPDFLSPAHRDLPQAEIAHLGAVAGGSSPPFEEASGRVLESSNWRLWDNRLSGVGNLQRGYRNYKYLVLRCNWQPLIGVWENWELCLPFLSCSVLLKVGPLEQRQQRPLGNSSYQVPPPNPQPILPSRYEQENFNSSVCEEVNHVVRNAISYMQI